MRGSRYEKAMSQPINRYKADLRDFQFLLFEQFKLDEALAHEQYKDWDRDQVKMVLDESYRFVKDHLGPLNSVGDKEGCKIVDGRVRTTFASPDVPLSRFRLSLRAGRGSLLTPNANVCRVPRRGPVNAVAHSGKRVDRTVGVRASCGGARAGARARARAGKVRRGAGRR